jgi:hypothetical protein
MNGKHSKTKVIMIVEIGLDMCVKNECYIHVNLYKHACKQSRKYNFKQAHEA